MIPYLVEDHYKLYGNRFYFFHYCSWRSGVSCRLHTRPVEWRESRPASVTCYVYVRKQTTQCWLWGELTWDDDKERNLCTNFHRSLVMNVRKTDNSLHLHEKVALGRWYTEHFSRDKYVADFFVSSSVHARCILSGCYHSVSSFLADFERAWVTTIRWSKTKPVILILCILVPS